MFNTFTTNFPTISFVTYKMSDFENFNFMECSYNVHKYFLMIKYHYNDIILNTSIHTKNQLSRISSSYFRFYGYFGRTESRFAIPSFSKVPLTDITMEVGRVVSVGDDTASVRVRESSLQTSPRGLCLCLRTRREGGNARKTS